VVTTPQSRFPLRLVGARLTPQGAEVARRRVRAAALKKGHPLDARTLQAAGFVLVHFLAKGNLVGHRPPPGLSVALAGGTGLQTAQRDLDPLWAKDPS